jgi:hypothetical protein
MPTPTHPQVNVMRRVRGLDPTGLELFFSEADASDTLYVTTLLPTRWLQTNGRFETNGY